MSEVTVEPSVDELGKIAAYHKSMEDRQKGVVKVAERVPADAGMAETGEMPSGTMSDQPIPTLPSDLAPGAMPARAMDDTTYSASKVAAGGMPRPEMK